MTLCYVTALVASRLLDPVALEGVVTNLERLSENLSARHRAVTAALHWPTAPLDRPIACSSPPTKRSGGPPCCAIASSGPRTTTPSPAPVLWSTGLAVPRAVVGDVGGNGSASGWELPGVSTMWQPWRSFGQHAHQALAQRGLAWPDHRPPLSTMLDPIGSLLAEVSGVAEAKRCLHGSLPDCGWFAAGLVPWGRMARVAHLARFADEVGGVVARARSRDPRAAWSLHRRSGCRRPSAEEGRPLRCRPLAHQARSRGTTRQLALPRGKRQSGRNQWICTTSRGRDTPPPRLSHH